MAVRALDIIRAKSGNSEELKKEYKSRMNNFPVMVMQSGLAQTSGFFLAKTAVHQEYLGDIAKILNAASGRPVANGNQLHERVIQCETVEYRLLTRDALIAAGWLKRYGQALLA